MNTLIFCLVASLALTSAKPFIHLVYYGTVATPYGTLYATPHATPFVIQPTQLVKQQPEVPVPTVKGAGKAPVSLEVTGAQVVSGASVGPVVSPGVQTVAVPISPFFTRYHAQAEDGSYSFGYSGGPSSRAETRDSLGNVQGAFNYVDPEGKIQTQQYVADSRGFRVAATNLPLAPLIDVSGPKPVEETAEVKAARAEFEKAFQQRKKESRIKRDADPAFLTSIPYKAPASTVPLNVINPVPFPTSYTAGTHYPFSFFPSVYRVPYVAPLTYPSISSLQPITYSATNQPVLNAKPGTLTKITHHPLAVSYRLDV